MVETPGAGGYGKPSERDQAADRERFRLGQVQPRLHQEELRRRAEGQAMSYDAIVIGAGISGAATAYHLRKAGAKTLLLERGEPASGGTGKSAAIIRQSYSTPLLVRLARASITMFENAQGRTRPAMRASCRTATASSSRRTCWTARRRTSRCRRASASSTNGRRGRAFRSICPRSIPKASPASSTSRTAATPIPVQATEAYVGGVPECSAANSARARRCGACCAQGDRITGVELDNGDDRAPSMS